MQLNVLSDPHDMMNILLLGSGGREHALAWKLRQSPILESLYIAPGNAGTALEGTNLPISPVDFPAIRTTVLEHNINMVIVGPEDPLVLGIHDFFLDDAELCAIPVIGPCKAGARLEGSKSFAKAFMQQHDIPTASYRVFQKENLEDGFAYLQTLSPPYVLKADGLAAGKGVVICQTYEEAAGELTAMIRDSRFGIASNQVVIEEFLTGIELSVFILTDGRSYKILPEAKDYKKIGEADTGPNTGGMGSVSPVPFADRTFMNKVETRIIRPTLNGLIQDGIPYSGFLFIGLMKVGDDPFVIEYNCRLGDPETESILPRMENDLVELLNAMASHELESKPILIRPETATTVMMVAGGYPGSYPKGMTITGEDSITGSHVFHAGTIRGDDQSCKTNGGRVIAVTSLGNSIQEALSTSLANAEAIRFEGRYFRRDIGFDLV